MQRVRTALSGSSFRREPLWRRTSRRQLCRAHGSAAQLLPGAARQRMTRYLIGTALLFAGVIVLPLTAIMAFGGSWTIGLAGRRSPVLGTALLLSAFAAIAIGLYCWIRALKLAHRDGPLSRRRTFLAWLMVMTILAVAAAVVGVIFSIRSTCCSAAVVTTAERRCATSPTRT